MKLLTPENLPALARMFTDDHVSLQALAAAASPDVPKDYVRVPGEPLGATFKSCLFERPERRRPFWVSNRYLRVVDNVYYMPVEMVRRINRGYEPHFPKTKRTLNHD